MTNSPKTQEFATDRNSVLVSEKVLMKAKCALHAPAFGEQCASPSGVSPAERSPRSTRESVLTVCVCVCAAESKKPRRSSVVRLTEEI